VLTDSLIRTYEHFVRTLRDIVIQALTSALVYLRRVLRENARVAPPIHNIYEANITRDDQLDVCTIRVCRIRIIRYLLPPSKQLCHYTYLINSNSSSSNRICHSSHTSWTALFTGRVSVRSFIHVRRNWRKANCSSVLRLFVIDSQ